MTPQPIEPLELFISYSHEDERLRDELETHLSTLDQEKVIQVWHDPRISAGREWNKDIETHLDSAAIILLLVSADFLASDYCRDQEVPRALARHKADKARVIPIILRSCNWESAIFAHLQALPKNGKPVRDWKPRDNAFTHIVSEVRIAVQEIWEGRSSGDDIRPPTSFVSRRVQGRNIIDQLKEELAPGRNRLIALWGAGGVGKTAIAAKVGLDLVDKYNQRVVWISADGHKDFDRRTLLHRIATQLSKELPLKQKEEQVCEAIPTLIILDNFETIAEAEQTKCLEFLSARASCSSLITTRQKIPSEWNIPIEVMSRTEAANFLRSLIGKASHRSAFAQPNRDRIMEESERNPLVMQWAVDEIDILQDTDAVLEKLPDGRGPAARRIFDRSFELKQLGDDGQATLLALSLFVPDASRHALAVVADLGDNERLNEAVKRLASLSLVRSADGRITTTDLTGVLAKARLERDKDTDKFHGRFEDYFLEFTKDRRSDIGTNHAELEAEKDNLIAAVISTLDRDHWNKTWKFVQFFADPNDGVWVLHEYWDEAKRLIEQVLEQPRAFGAKSEARVFAPNLARMLCELGWCAKGKQRPDIARWLAESSLAICEELENQPCITAAKGLLESLHEDESNGENRTGFSWKFLV